MKIKRAIIWTAFNAAIATAAWLAVNGNEYAARIFGFWAWFSAISSFLIFAVLPESEKQKIRQKGYSVPPWLNYSADTAIILLLAAHGWTALAIASVVSMLSQAAVMTNKDKP